MSPSFQIDPEKRRVTLEYLDHPTFVEWVGTMDAIFADAKFERGFDFLFDKSAVRDAANNGYVDRVVAFYEGNADKLGKCAIVVNDVVSFGMTRMTASRCDPDSVRAFMEVKAAIAWLASATR